MGERQRPAYHQWYSTYRWQRLRKQQLGRHPLCAMCLPKAVPARVCDHIEPHKGNVDKFWNGPFQSLCKPCHDGLKQRIEKGRQTIGEDGWPL
jgi:5-methylcytosine-specific restriction protein A